MAFAKAAMQSAYYHKHLSYQLSTPNHIYISSPLAIFRGISTISAMEEVAEHRPNAELQGHEINRENKNLAHAQEGTAHALGFNACASLLQACNNVNELRKVHGRIIISGLERNMVLGARLVKLYAEHGNLEQASHVFDKMRERNLFVWNAIIRGCAKNGLWQETLELYYGMRRFGIEPDNLTFPLVLRACAGLSALQDGKEIHFQVCRSGFESDIYVGNALIDMYAKCGSVMDARHLFDKMPHRDVVSWTAMIAGYAQNDEAREALLLFNLMQCSYVQPNLVTVVNVLTACAQFGDLHQGECIHNYVVVSGFQSDVSVGTALIDMYAKCGSIEKARLVFDNMYERNIVSWTAVITGYVQNGYGREALTLFHQMLMTNMKPDSVTITNALSACISLGDLDQGKQIHDYVVQSGFGLDIVVGNFLVAMYAKCRNLHVARELFDGLQKTSLVSWNALIGGYAQKGHTGEALALFRQMQLADVKPNSTTMVSLLSACALLVDVQQCICIHNYIIKCGFDSNVFAGTALIDIYCKCGRIEFAREVFDTMCEKNVVSWSAMIAGYVQKGHANEALMLFREMQISHVIPNLVTMVSLLPACSNLADLEQGKCIHEYIIRSGFQSDISVGTALIDMYAKSGDIEAAAQLFDKMSKRDVVSWNAMITGYAQSGHVAKALTLFHDMQLADVKPNSVTMTCVLPACAHLAALEQGKRIHDYIVLSGFDLDISVVTALIDMYTKCGAIYCARELFDKMVVKDVVLWNAMIGGYGMHGNSKDALELFGQMQSTCIKPDHITFLCILSACSHAGLVSEGWQYFKCMTQVYCIIPSMEHYSCMVDLLGRAGQLDEAYIFIKNMLFEPDAGVWGALLGACRIYCNIQLGEIAAKHLFRLEPDNAGHYVLLSNMYAAAGRWDDMAEVRRMMKSRRLKKTPGYSSIEVNDRVHLFVVED